VSAKPYPVDPVTGRALLGGRAIRYRVDHGLIGVSLPDRGVVHLYDVGSKATDTLCNRPVDCLAPVTTMTATRLCLTCGRRRDEQIRGGR
jgi:hypothetical protein